MKLIIALTIVVLTLEYARSNFPMMNGPGGMMSMLQMMQKKTSGSGNSNGGGNTGQQGRPGAGFIRNPPGGGPPRGFPSNIPRGPPRGIGGNGPGSGGGGMNGFGTGIMSAMKKLGVTGQSGVPKDLPKGVKLPDSAIRAMGGKVPNSGQSSRQSQPQSRYGPPGAGGQNKQQQNRQPSQGFNAMPNQHGTQRGRPSQQQPQQQYSNKPRYSQQSQQQPQYQQQQQQQVPQYSKAKHMPQNQRYPPQHQQHQQQQQQPQQNQGKHMTATNNSPSPSNSNGMTNNNQPQQNRHQQPQGQQHPHFGYYRPPPPSFNNCSVTDFMCEFSLFIEERLTMVHKGRVVKILASGKFAYKDDPSNTPITDAEDIIAPDESTYKRRVLTANGIMPGPTLNVHDGQEVVVHVINRMMTDIVAIHFHGIDMFRTPWSDGTPFITQCPISPGQKYTYRFRAGPVGTHYYHSQVAQQAGNGLYGALIVHKRNSSQEASAIVQLADWNSAIDYNELYLLTDRGSTVVNSATNADNMVTTLLVNGRGYIVSPPTLPLTTYNIASGAKLCLRLINTAVETAIYLYIDKHRLKIIAADGIDLAEGKLVDMINLWPGERYDVEILGDQTPGTYAIVVGYVFQPTLKGQANLQYDGVVPVNPGAATTATNPVMLGFTENAVTLIAGTSITLEDLKGKWNAPTIFSRRYKRQIFLNFANVRESDNHVHPTVNGHSFVPPSVLTLTTPGGIVPCDRNLCGTGKVCHCTYGEHLKLGGMVQVVLVNMGDIDNTVHFHGYRFYVMKTVKQTFDGTKVIPSVDLACSDPAGNLTTCRHYKFSNESWNIWYDNIPGLKRQNNVLKDTILIPAGSYVIVRIVTDFPGPWFVHSTIGTNYVNGQGLICQVGEPGRVAVPPDVPKCGNFDAGIRRWIDIPDDLFYNTHLK